MLAPLIVAPVAVKVTAQVEYVIETRLNHRVQTTLEADAIAGVDFVVLCDILPAISCTSTLTRCSSMIDKPCIHLSWKSTTSS